MAVVAGMPEVSAAEPNARGYYTSVMAGVAIPGDSDLDTATTNESADLDSGFTTAAALGHRYGNGLSTEIELAYAGGDLDTVSGATATGDAEIYSLMAGIRYHLPVGGPVRPFVDAGIGLALVDVDDASPIAGSRISDSDGAFAWRAGAGISWPASKRIELTLSYRYFAVPDLGFATDAGASVDSDYRSHSVLFGLRYRFGGPARKIALMPPAAAVSAVPAIAPAPAVTPPQPLRSPAPKHPSDVASAEQIAAPPKSYLVFFDWDRAKLTRAARRIVRTAAGNARRIGATRIEVTGHADRSGGEKYNLKLSRKRALAVRAALVRNGLPPRRIAIFAEGETHPLVATKDGMREPQNRRTELILKIPKSSRLSGPKFTDRR